MDGGAIAVVSTKGAAVAVLLITAVGVAVVKLLGCLLVRVGTSIVALPV